VINTLLLHGCILWYLSFMNIGLIDVFVVIILSSFAWMFLWYLSIMDIDLIDVLYVT